MTIYKFENTAIVELKSSKFDELAGSQPLIEVLGEISPIAADLSIVGNNYIVGLFIDILLLARDIALLSYTYDELAKMSDDEVIDKVFGIYTINEVDDI